jgi:2-oxoisovalerate dehydrogenase E2 component (dihydrolipoyl transacylase)
MRGYQVVRGTHSLSLSRLIRRAGYRNVTPKSTIQSFDPLCEVQSDKASVEITSPFDGVVKQILVDEGQVAKVGAGLCLIEVEEEEGATEVITPAETQPVQEKIEQEPPAAPTVARRLHPLDPSYAPSQAGPRKPGVAAEDILAAPSVRHFARKGGVDLAHVAPGSGKDGRIEKADVEAYLSRSSSPLNEPKLPGKPASAPSHEGVVVELGRTRYSMWKAMTKVCCFASHSSTKLTYLSQSLEIPTFGYTTTLDLTPLHHLLPILNASIPPHYLTTSNSSTSTTKPPIVDPSAFYPVPAPPDVPDSGRYTKLTYLPILLKTLSKAMMEWPIFRASLTPASSNSGDKPTLNLRPHTDISLALSTPTGLYTPTLARVDEVPIYALASQIAHLAYLGRQVPCRLTMNEMPKRGGTISVSNIGAVGRGEDAVPVLVQDGGVAIVALGGARWVWDVEAGREGDVRYYVGGGGGGERKEGQGGKRGRGEERLKMSVSWSADHRVVEGAELAAFVESWRRWVEIPERLIAEGK